MTDELKALVDFLNDHPPGPIADSSQLSEVLASCWHELKKANDGGMAGYKLRGRMEFIAWHPPLLAFTIERHGGTVLGSKNGELQHWSVDLQEMSASFGSSVRRLHANGKRLDVKPIAAEIAAMIFAGTDDPRLKWRDDNSVRIQIDEVIPADGLAKDTVSCRRKRFRTALTQKLGEAGWSEVRANSYVRGVATAAAIESAVK